MADKVKLTTVQIRQDDGWLEVAVIDGRRYPDRQSFDLVKNEAFKTMNGLHIPAQFETRSVSPTEPPSRLPAWEDYRQTLAPKGS
jgi:hypothetical protein